mmetsp:Transcript_7952/g.16117  ORF Transcript_7952/g.16117 Transcript_7952/m.16117 type:complete len:126 (-) Transcript_7952:93-470(-)
MSVFMCNNTYAAYLRATTAPQARVGVVVSNSYVIFRTPFARYLPLMTPDSALRFLIRSVAVVTVRTCIEAGMNYCETIYPAVPVAIELSKIPALLNQKLFNLVQSILDSFLLVVVHWAMDSRSIC